jgi:hypothetical protein
MDFDKPTRATKQIIQIQTLCILVNKDMISEEDALNVTEEIIQERY